MTPRVPTLQNIYATLPSPTTFELEHGRLIDDAAPDAKRYTHHSCALTVNERDTAVSYDEFVSLHIMPAFLNLSHMIRHGPTSDLQQQFRAVGATDDSEMRYRFSHGEKTSLWMQVQYGQGVSYDEALTLVKLTDDQQAHWAEVLARKAADTTSQQEQSESR